VEGLLEEAGMRQIRLAAGRIITARIVYCLDTWRTSSQKDGKRRLATEADILSKGQRDLEIRLQESLRALAINEEIGAAAEEEISFLMAQNASLEGDAGGITASHAAEIEAMQASHAGQVEALKASLHAALQEGERSSGAAAEHLEASGRLEAQMAAMREGRTSLEEELCLAQGRIEALGIDREEREGQLRLALDTLEALNRHHRQVTLDNAAATMVPPFPLSALASPLMMGSPLGPPQPLAACYSGPYLGGTGAELRLVGEDRGRQQRDVDIELELQAMQQRQTLLEISARHGTPWSNASPMRQQQPMRQPPTTQSLRPTLGPTTPSTSKVGMEIEGLRQDLDTAHNVAQSQRIHQQALFALDHLRGV